MKHFQYITLLSALFAFVSATDCPDLGSKKKCKRAKTCVWDDGTCNYRPEYTPTAMPTDAPTEVPTDMPTEAPTAAPFLGVVADYCPFNYSKRGCRKNRKCLWVDDQCVYKAKYTDAPTGSPTLRPTETPTESPTDSPTEAPFAGVVSDYCPWNYNKRACRKNYQCKWVGKECHFKPQFTDAPTAQPSAFPTEEPTASPTEGSGVGGATVASCEDLPKKVCKAQPACHWVIYSKRNKQCEWRGRLLERSVASKWGDRVLIESVMALKKNLPLSEDMHMMLENLENFVQ